MNIDTVETVADGIDADDLDFDSIVNKWQKYAQDTWRVKDGKIYSNVNNGAGSGAGHWGTGLFCVEEGGSLSNSDNLEADFKMVTTNGDNPYGKYYTGLHEGFAFNVTINPDGTLSGYYISNGHHLVVPSGAPWASNYSGKDGEVDYDLRVLWRFDNVNLNQKFSTAEMTSDSGMVACTTHNQRKYTIWHTLGDTLTSAEGGSMTNLGMWYDTGKDVEYKVKFKNNRIQIWNTQAGSQDRYKNGTDRVADRDNAYRALPSWDKTGEYYDEQGVYHGADDSEACLDVTQTFDDRSVSYYDNIIDENIVTLYNNSADYNANMSSITQYGKQYGTPKFAGTYGKAISSGSYGFWGNNCEQNGAMQVNDMRVSVIKQVVKSFGDIVYEPEWTDGALHMLINMDTKTDSTMLGNDGGRPACERPEPCHGQRPMNVLYICAEDAAGLLVSDDGAGAGPRPRPTPSGSPRGWRRTRRRSWRGTTT